MIVAATREPSPTGWTPAALVAALEELAERPTIVIDAVDEAADPAGLVNDLLIPLAEHGANRLLVATRRTMWLSEWRHEPAVVDLDAVDAAELRSDLEHHLLTRLSDSERYRGSFRAVGA